LDRTGSLVVIELKRTEDGGFMELQAVRYAAMVSTLSFNQAITAHASFEGGSGGSRSVDSGFPWCDRPPDDFGHTVRIILVSPDFSRL
jgi:hypothetical protein